MNPNKSSEIALMILEVIPSIMHTVRMEMRAAIKSDLTIPQLRVLAHIFRGISDASALAEIQGVSLPAMSKMIDGLVKRKLVERRSKKDDRRQAQVCLTAVGKKCFLQTRRLTQSKISERIAKLGLEKQSEIIFGLEALRKTFGNSK